MAHEITVEGLPPTPDFDSYPVPTAIVAVTRQVGGWSLEEGLALELDCYNSLVDSVDRREGIRAFNEKRKPAFQGR